MVGCHHLLNGHEFEQASEVSDGQGSLACCSPWGCEIHFKITDNESGKVLYDVGFGTAKYPTKVYD